MTSRTWLAGAAFVVAACAQSAPLQLLVTPQSRLGLGEGFGPGIVTATARSLTYRIDARAYVIVLRVLDGGAIQQVWPVGNGPERALERGTYSLEADARLPSYPPPPHVPGGIGHGGWTADLAMAGPELRPVPVDEREGEAGYWLVIASDRATQPAEVDARLRALELDAKSTLIDNLRLIPGALLGGRTTNWNAYYVSFAVLSVRTR